MAAPPSRSSRSAAGTAGSADPSRTDDARGRASGGSAHAVDDDDAPSALEPDDLDGGEGDIDPFAPERQEVFPLDDAEARGGDEELPSPDETDIIDVPSAGLIRRRGVSLPAGRGEWISGEETSAKAESRREVQELYQAFVRYATSFPRLTEEQERALGLKVRDFQDDGAAKKLVVHNLRLALKMAHQHRRAWTNLMDLVQEASAGMAIAAQRWDPDQGTRFGTYAVYWIRAQLTKFLMTHGRIIHTGSTRAGRKLYFQLPQVRRRLLAAGKEPTIEAIAEEVGESPEEVARIVNRLDGREASLSAPLHDDEDGSTLGEMIAGAADTPEEQVGSHEVNALIGKVILRFGETLTDERDQAIWREHLISDDPVSLVDLGKRYGVSKQRMGQLATRIKRAFRRHIIEELGPHTQLHWLFHQD